MQTHALGVMAIERTRAEAQDDLNARGLALLLPPGGRFEVRTLGKTKKGTASKLFGSDKLSEAVAYAQAQAALKTTKGVYFTLNPVRPDLVLKKGSATKDQDIVTRRLLLVDFDPKRAEGFEGQPATDAEKELALDQAGVARGILRALGWPEPILCDSGNGHHLLYLIDLPTDDGGLVQRVLKAMGLRFATASVEFDTSNFNPSRITKFYSTLTRKGTESPGRPWRESKVLEVPDAFMAVPRALLENLAAPADVPTAPPASVVPGDNGEARKKTNKNPRVGGRARDSIIDDFNARMSWEKLLLDAGWNLETTRGDGEQYWVRPGKTAGHGASLYYKGENDLWIWTNRVPGFEPNRYYDKFEFYARTQHGGNKSAAAIAARHLGYGGGNGQTRGQADSAGGDGGAGVPPAEPRYASAFDNTDLGNARRLVRLFGEDIRYCHAWKTWFVWNGTQWVKDESGEIKRRAHRTIQEIGREAAECEDDKEADKLFRWAIASHSKRAIEAMVVLAQDLPGIPITPAELDTNPWLLNCLNGTINLRDGSLNSPHREDYITKLCPVRYDGEALCPLWLATLDLVFASNPELIDFWQLLCGYFLTGDIGEQILPILHGKGANGKTTLCTTLINLLGPDYAMSAKHDFLMARNGFGGHPTEVASLFGKRLVVATETNEGERFDEAKIKFLTGGETIRTRRMREDEWEFKPTHKLALCTNHEPDVRGTDHAIWRRLLKIPFAVQIPVDQQDTQMLAKLAREFPGILTWAVRGCLAWQREGRLKPPLEITSATQEYRDDQDILGRFFADRCALVGIERSGKLYTAYKEWANASGEVAISLTAFGKRMKERGIEKHSDGKNISYRGISLRQPEATD